MLESLKTNLRELKEGKPGERFIEAYRKRKGAGRNVGSLIVSYVGGLALIVLGVIALVAPGPGIIMIAAGGALLSRESERMARLLDWLEVRGRRLADWGLARWRKASTPARAALVTSAILVAGVAAFGAYAVLVRG